MLRLLTLTVHRCTRSASQRRYSGSITRIQTADSPVDVVQHNKKLIYIKRDDLLSSYYPGNKYRKLCYFIEQLRANPTRWNHVVSYGGNQSNLMLAAAHLAREFQCQFTYFTKRVSPRALESTSESNWHVTRNLGAHVIECQTEAEAHQRFLEYPESPGQLKIGRAEEFLAAEYGIKQLALSLHQFITTHLAGRDVSIVTPAGTGATAYFVNDHLQRMLRDTCQRVTVYAVPVVGNADSLLDDMTRMSKCQTDTSTTTYLPHILNTKNRYRFAKPHRDLFDVHQTISEFGIEFDMVYSLKAWRAIFEHQSLFATSALVYIHTGGVSGNVTQKERYARALQHDITKLGEL